MPEFLIPFGPFHMVLLHLPIGALTAIWFLEFLLEKNDDKHKNQAIGLLHLLLLLSCGLTVVLGLSYEEFGQYGDEIEQHEFVGCCPEVAIPLRNSTVEIISNIDETQYNFV